MSDFDAREEPLPEQVRQPAVVPPRHDEDVPARRLLAHDLEHLVWDDDGEGANPPPD
jgi:hypothetical protein